MTDVKSDNTIPQPPAATSAPVPRSRRGRIALFAALILATAGITGAAVTKAVSNPFGFGPGFHGRWGTPLDPAQIEDRADRMVRHLAVEIDATNEQQDKLRGIVRAMLKDVLPARERAHDARRQARELLTAQTIDRAAIEKLRAEQIALADSVSKRVTQAIGDAAEVLSPEQRRKLADHFPPHRRGFGPRWHRGG